MSKQQDILQTIARYRELGIEEQIDYKKFYLYSIITHSTAIEGSTVTEIENQLLFDEGITAPGRTLQEQMMNLDLKAAYEEAQRLADRHMPYSIDMLCRLSSIVMKNTGKTYNTILGSFSLPHFLLFFPFSFTFFFFVAALLSLHTFTFYSKAFFLNPIFSINLTLTVFSLLS